MVDTVLAPVLGHVHLVVLAAIVIERGSWRRKSLAAIFVDVDEASAIGETQDIRDDEHGRMAYHRDGLSLRRKPLDNGERGDRLVLGRVFENRDDVMVRPQDD